MCTALSLKTKDRYFGRNLDIDRSYGEEICVMPRRFPLVFREMGEVSEHYAIIGAAAVLCGFPLFYEGANEYGLAMAGLNFPGNAFYSPASEGKENVAPFEFIPWVLSQSKTLAEAKILLSRINLANIPFSKSLPPAPLHWIISNGESALTVEFTAEGLHICDNPLGILTNNPPFRAQCANLERYRNLRNSNAGVILKDPAAYSQGLGALGLPGDLSSASRFARIAFGKENSLCEKDEASSVGQFFHLLSTVEMVNGLCKTDEGSFDITRYTSCINLNKGIYYYTTYCNRRISRIDMFREDLEGENLIRFPFLFEEDIFYQN